MTTAGPPATPNRYLDPFLQDLGLIDLATAVESGEGKSWEDVSTPTAPSRPELRKMYEDYVDYWITEFNNAADVGDKERQKQCFVALGADLLGPGVWETLTTHPVPESPLLFKDVVNEDARRVLADNLMYYIPPSPALRTTLKERVKTDEEKRMPPRQLFADMMDDSPGGAFQKRPYDFTMGCFRPISERV